MTDYMARVLDWFGRVESQIPGARTWVGEIILGQVPLASAEKVYELAVKWEAVATEVAS